MEDQEGKLMLQMMDRQALYNRLQLANEQRKNGTYKSKHEEVKTPDEILLEDYYSEVDDLLSEDTCDDMSFSLSIRCFGTKNKHEVFINNCNDHLNEADREQADAEYSTVIHYRDEELKEERSERKQRRARRAAKNAEILAGRAERRREYLESMKQEEQIKPVKIVDEPLKQSSPPAKKRARIGLQDLSPAKSRSPSSKSSYACTALKNGEPCNQPLMVGSTTVCSLECKKIRRNFNQRNTRKKPQIIN